MNFDQLVTLCQRTHEEISTRASRAVDAHLVARNWLFGHYILEYEQQGAYRADYGTRLLSSLASNLKPLGIKGTGSTNLKLFRQFYLTYREIGQTLSDFSENLPAIGQTSPDQSTPIIPQILANKTTLSVDLQSRFPLGWSHYVELLTNDSPDAH